MTLLAVGINHKTAPVAIRERVVFSPDKITTALQELTVCPGINEAAILSTCNRTELFCDTDDLDGKTIIEWLRRYHQLELEEISPFIYIHPSRSAVRHVLRVASGLDSMILGEPQILGQIKDAYGFAVNAGTIGKHLGRLFQHSFSVAKQVRTDTAIGASPVSVAFAAVSLAKQLFSNFASHSAMLIGAGETIELTARHLKENGIGKLTIANRTLERAETLAKILGADAIALSEVPDKLIEADIVITSTASQLPILGKGAVERAIKARKHRPILMVDIAVPRDIEPEVRTLDDIYLYSVDDLREIIDENLKSRREAAEQAEEIIDQQVEYFMGWLKSLNSVDTIRSFRENAHEIQNRELEKARKMIMAGQPVEEALKYLARNLTNKLLHTPSSRIRKAGFEDRKDLIEAARELFDLDHEKNR